MIPSFALDPAILGILTALMTGVLTLIPALGATDVRRNWTAILTLIVGSFLFGGFHYVDVQSTVIYLVTVAVYALTTYKFFLQNLVTTPSRQYLMRRSPEYNRDMLHRGYSQ